MFIINLCQYSADTFHIFDDTETSLLFALNVLKRYAQFSGLGINMEKTKAVWIGKKKDSDDELTLLGITFSIDFSKITYLKYVKKTEESKQLLSKS